MHKIDLHGLRVHDGWKRFRSSTVDAYIQGHKQIVVVVGQGEMSKEFEKWCEADPYVRETRRLDRNAGAFRVILKKKK